MSRFPSSVDPLFYLSSFQSPSETPAACAAGVSIYLLKIQTRISVGGLIDLLPARKVYKPAGISRIAELFQMPNRRFGDTFAQPGLSGLRQFLVRLKYIPHCQASGIDLHHAIKEMVRNGRHGICERRSCALHRLLDLPVQDKRHHLSFPLSYRSIAMAVRIPVWASSHRPLFLFMKTSPHPSGMPSCFHGLSHGLKKCPPDTFLPSLRSGRPFESCLPVYQKRGCPLGILFFGTPEGTRTPNPRNRNPMLYPLSHRRICFDSLNIIAGFSPFVKREK